MKPPDSPDSIADEIIAELLEPPTSQDAKDLVYDRCPDKTITFKAGVILALARRRRAWETERDRLAKEPPKDNANWGTWG